MTTVITTFSQDGYDLYGKRMVETWLAHWPKEYTLRTYVEDFDIDRHKRIEQVNLNKVCPKLLDFKKYSQKLLKKYAGDDKQEKRINKTVKWCHKVFAIDHALRTCTSDYVIYLDADTYSFNAAPPDLGKKLCENNLLAVHFEKLLHGLHFETGLIVFNRRHERLQEFLDLYVEGYTTYKIYDMKKTWDSYWLVHLYEEYELPISNLGNKTNKVFNNPIIKTFMAHDVGPEKYINANFDRYTGRKR
jgi:hypothetical protein